MTSTTDLVTREHLEQFRDEGYFVLDSVLTDEQLELLRGGAQYSIDKLDAAMDAAGTDSLGINHRGKRYFSSMIYQDRPELRQFLFSDTMAEICRATLGDEAYLFWEQYVIKAGDPNTAFAWHQDSGYVHEDHEPYLTCWIALDDVTEENGSVYLLPYSRSGIRSYIKHIQDPELNDMVCYFGSDPGIPMTARRARSWSSRASSSTAADPTSPTGTGACTSLSTRRRSSRPRTVRAPTGRSTRSSTAAAIVAER